MSKVIGLLVAAGVAGIAIAQPAAASNLDVLKAQGSSPAVTLVADGCGRGWHRDRWGYCHRDRRVYDYYYERPEVYFYAPYYYHRPYYWHRGW